MLKEINAQSTSLLAGCALIVEGLGLVQSMIALSKPRELPSGMRDEVETAIHHAYRAMESVNRIAASGMAHARQPANDTGQRYRPYPNPKGTSMTEENVIEGATFGQTEVPLELGVYRNCTFNRSVLVYSGMTSAKEIGLQGCTLNDVQFLFTGPAAATIEFLKALYPASTGLQKAVIDWIESAFPGMVFMGETSGA